MSEDNIPYFQRFKQIKLGLAPKEAVAKPKAPIKKVSDKKAEEIKQQKEFKGEDETMKERWFQRRRPEMIGVCQCGCGMPSSKNDDKNFRSSICHIFPQRLFPSVQFHHLNWVERKFWATESTPACHTNMDNRSMDLWVNFADWDDIKEKFHILTPLLTDAERTTKFYTHLEKLIYSN